MKTVLFVLTAFALTAGLYSCGSSKSVSNYLANHNYKEEHSYNELTGKTKLKASIDSIYDYKAVSEYCDTIDATFHFAKGSVTIEATCDGAVEKVKDLFKKVYQLIQFKK